MNSNYLEALKFWNQAFEMDEETKKQYRQEVDPENDWRELASIEKLRDILIDKLADKNRVLDYGCGDGWAGITLSKSGCKDVTSVDLVENAIKLANFYKELFNVNSGFTAECVSNDWIENAKADYYDGFFCSNVLDVIPETVSNEIIKNIARITTRDAKIIISMNYYAEPVSNPEKNIEVKNSNEVYVNGILRMVTRTDEEWKEIFSKYFEVEAIEYFAWPGEKEEKRRIFILNNK